MRSFALAAAVAAFATFTSEPPQFEYPPVVKPAHVLGMPVADLRALKIPDVDEIEAAGPSELDALQRDLAPLVPRLASSARMIDELYGWRRPDADGTWRCPGAIDARDFTVHQLARAFRAEALLASRRGDPTRAVRILLTVLRLAAILESQPIGDHPDLWLLHPQFIRNMVAYSLRDPHTIAGAAPAELERLRAFLVEHEPPADAWERVVRAMPDAVVKEMGALLYRNRGASLGGTWLERLIVPHDAAERGLWMETARERLHEHARRTVAAVTADCDATLDALYALRNSDPAPRGTLALVLGRAWRAVSSSARAEECARQITETIMGPALRILLVRSLQGQRLLMLRVQLEQVRQTTGRYPDALPADERYRKDVAAGRPLLYERTADGYRLEAQDTRHIIWRTPR